MKKYLFLLPILLMALLTSCNMSTETEIGTREQLIGRWQSGTDYIVFYDEDAGDGLSWGKEWNSDDKLESDLDDPDMDYHGNGWFKWKKGVDYITAANMVNISQAEAAIDWKLFELTDTQMKLRQTSRIVTFQKISE